MSERPPILDQLRVFSFLSQDRVPTSGAFAVLPVDVPPRSDGARAGPSPVRGAHSA